jgi:two-component system cell cycle response regulator DivK
MTAGRILIVEDNTDNLELVKFLLEKAGHQVFSALDGRQGLEMARQIRPDLILLDLTLPAIDGWHVARMLKADPSTQTIKVVALTAHALPGDRRKALNSGCDGYLSKPLDIASFTGDIEKYLTNR